MDNNVWDDIRNDLDADIQSLQAKDRKYEVSGASEARRGMAPREMVGYADTYDKIPPIKRNGRPTKRVVAGQNVVFENAKKMKDIILKVVIAASLAGIVGVSFKVLEKADADDLENDVTMEQEYTPEAIAAQFAQKEKNTPSEVEYIQDVNNGVYSEPLVTDQFSTEKIDAPHVSSYEEKVDEVKHVNTWSATEGYTPLSQDPNYNPPTEEDLDRLREEAGNSMSR